MVDKKILYSGIGLVLILAVIAVVLFVPQNGLTTYERITMKTYSNDDFSFKYDSDWNLIEKSPFILLYVPDKQNPEEKSKVFVSISEVPTKEGVTFETFLEKVNEEVKPKKIEGNCIYTENTVKDFFYATKICIENEKMYILTGKISNDVLNEYKAKVLFVLDSFEIKGDNK